MFKTGLVTISFRALSPAQVVAIAATAGLEALEWGGDVHVPPTDPENARQVAAQTAAAGLVTAAYGSYYRLGQNADPAAAFAPVLETAGILGAPVIRVWGGTKGSADLTDADWDALVTEGRLLVAMAAEKGVTLSLECHGNTLTDDYRTALRYLEAVPGMTMYWQPNQLRNEEYNQEAAAALAPYTTNLHVFHWSATARHPLSEGEAVWQQYLRPFTGADHGLLLEFMHDDKPESLNETAATLRRLIEQAGREE